VPVSAWKFSNKISGLEARIGPVPATCSCNRLIAYILRFDGTREIVQLYRGANATRQREARAAMRAKGISGLILAALLLSPALADDIVWPTYARSTYVTDAALTCDQLHATIDHVTRDVALLAKARDQVGEIIHNKFALQSSIGTIGDRRFTAATSPSGEDPYVLAHDRIAASRTVALARLDYLNGLVPACKPAPNASDGTP
jgi:hypothetical protein